MKQAYINRNFTLESERLIDIIDGICDDYTAQGYVLTVRQLYYQLVARNIIPNTERSYKNTTSLVNDARLAGLIDWDAIEDRTRAFVDRPHWETGKDFLTSVSPQFYSDMWKGQDFRVFCIVEKEALAGVLEGVCHHWDVPMLAARGYPSVSVLREFAIDRILPHSHNQTVKILHLGDHDPSGIDMSRDLEDRLNLLCGGAYKFEIERIALNMDQVEENNCPPNPAKLTDSRIGRYIAQFGHESWELDALEPAYLTRLVERHVKTNIDEDRWAIRKWDVDTTRERLEVNAAQFQDPIEEE